MNEKQGPGMTRREFVERMGFAGAALGLAGATAAGGAEPPRDAAGNVIPGFEKGQDNPRAAKGWQPVSERKDRVGIAGHGQSKFGAFFFYQNHPNVEVVAATDLDPDRCAALAREVGAKKTYPSCEEMIKDKNIEAIYIATDCAEPRPAGDHAPEHGKHVVSAVPAVFGFQAEDEAEKLFHAVRKSGMKYMMNETSTFHEALYAKRMQCQASALGKIIYSEGEYWHDGIGTLAGFNPKNGKIDEHGWRCAAADVVPHPRHRLLCLHHRRPVHRSVRPRDRKLLPGVQGADQPIQEPVRHGNRPLKTSEGGISRMGVSWDMKNAEGEQGRVYGQKPHNNRIKEDRPPLPPGVGGGGHGGSHGI